MNTYGSNNFFSSSRTTTNSTMPILACDSCDRSFPTKSAFNKHMSEHRVCGIDGCTLSAHEKILEKHIQMQHSSGIYEKMKELNSPENIAKWIEQRKSKFPSKDNIEKRHRQQEELWKKGIRIGERKPKLGRDRRGFIHKDPQTWRKERENNFKKKEQRRGKFIRKFQPKILIDDKSDWNNGLAPFKGMKELFELEKEESFTISDDEDDMRKPTKIEDLVKVNSSLGALMGYGSDYSEEDNEECKKINNSTPKVNSTEGGKTEVKQKENSDDEGPLEIKFQKTTAPTKVEEIGKSNEFNAKRRARKTNVKTNREQNTSYKFKTRKISQLDRILDSDIRRERNIILQCVRFTVQNNFFTKTS